jgi:thiol-disulfide isomerase/thioredoxin/tetratricopeptide (TPR) repeat protein
VLAALVAVAGGAWGQTLKVGDPAPKLAVGEFVKGEPVKELAKGTVYVLEFWATWCGPCRTAIPHVTELQAKYKDQGVVMIGVDVWERDLTKVKPFVAEMGEKMNYRVAFDQVTPEVKTGLMAKTWMAAAGRNGIPASFIVNKDGVIAWVGHPMSMDEPLAKVVAGTWDIAAFGAENAKENARRAKEQAWGEALRKAGADPAARAKVYRDWIAEDPTVERRVGTQLLYALNQPASKDAAIEYANRLLGTVYKGDAMLLGGLANALLTTGRGQTAADPALLKIALTAAQQASELSGGKNPQALTTLGRAHLANGDKAKAVECCEQALVLAKDDANALRSLVFTLIGTGPEPRTSEPALLKVGLSAAQRADELSAGKDAFSAALLGRAWLHNGDKAKAVEHLDRAVKLAKGQPMEKFLNTWLEEAHKAK